MSGKRSHHYAKLFCLGVFVLILTVQLVSVQAVSNVSFGAISAGWVGPNCASSELGISTSLSADTIDYTGDGHQDDVVGLVAIDGNGTPIEGRLLFFGVYSNQTLDLSVGLGRINPIAARPITVKLYDTGYTDLFPPGVGSQGAYDFIVSTGTLKAESVVDPATVLQDCASLPLISSSSEIDYFALGDSIASGHGLMDDGLPCRRSTISYPRKVIGLLEARYNTVYWTHAACSGATAIRPNDQVLTLDQYKWFRNQVDYVVTHLSDRPTLVSITIGANDFGWADPFTFVSHLYLQSDAAFQQWVNITTARVKIELKSQINRLLSYPNISIVVTEYHNPFNHNSIFFIGVPGNRCGIVECYGRAQYGITRLNGSFSDIWVELGRPSRLQIAAVDAAFSGHESPQPTCGNAPPDVNSTWVQYRNDPNSNSYPDIPGWLRRLTGEWRGDCFHPNNSGATAYANAVNDDAIRLGR